MKARASRNRLLDFSHFVALDFETADGGRDSACSVGLIHVREGEIVKRAHWYIRPPRTYFEFTYIHGITWQRVAKEPTFAEWWPRLAKELHGVDFVAAHNASFDRGVLQACCDAAGVAIPETPFECTMRLARRVWSVRPTKLPDVCRFLNIPLRHHDALSDAEACARIVLAAQAHVLQAAASPSVG
jgi:DNA polymerase-3 subunit epsilon